jgi:uroporphyrinogen decarboxylase
MTSVERILRAIRHQVPDRVPRGEFRIAPGLVKKLCPDSGLSFFQRQKAVMERLRMDCLAVAPSPKAVQPEEGSKEMDIWGRLIQWRHGHPVTLVPAIQSFQEAGSYQFPAVEDFSCQEMAEWADGTDFFVFALLDGIFQGLGSLFSFPQFLMGTVTEAHILSELAGRYGEFLLALAKRCLAAGAHGIMIGDDLAYKRGLLVSLQTLEQVFFPVYGKLLKELKPFGKPVFLHCDGNIQFLLPAIKNLGFDGIHSLEPAAGMELGRIKKEVGGQLCLMGNMDPALLVQGKPGEVREQVQRVLKEAAAERGGFILSTASGMLTDDMPPENILAMYLADS